MLVSRNHKVLFVHISRTGGASIRNVLHRHLDDAEEICGYHAPAREARTELGEPYEQLYRFAFVRNPWGRLLSWHAMISATHQQQGSAAMSFDEFLDCWVPRESESDRSKLEVPNQIDSLAGEDGELLLDYVGRFEKFANDLEPVLRRINAMPSAGIPSINGSMHDHYSRYYSKEGRDRVAAAYRPDIEYFGYEFEERT